MSNSATDVILKTKKLLFDKRITLEKCLIYTDTKIKHTLNSKMFKTFFIKSTLLKWVLFRNRYILIL